MEKNGLYFKTLFISITISFFISCVQTDSLPDDVSQEVQSRIDLGYHLNTVIGVIDSNGTHFYSFGQMSLTDSEKPDQNSIYEIGSITKSFTSVLLADLELNQQIDLNSSIADYLPVFKQVTAEANRSITWEDLINHTSGLPRNPNNTRSEDSNRYRDYTVDMLNSYLTTCKIEAKKSYLYSNLAYVVLEHAIEVKMKQSYESLINKNVLSPLGMKDTYFEIPAGKRSRLVTPYRSGAHVEELMMGQFPAGGGLKSTAADMLRFLEAQLGIYSSSLNAGIRVAHIERFSNEKETLGLAWSIMKREDSGKTLYYHKGGTNGFVSFAGFNIDDQIAVIVLASGYRYFSDLGFVLLDPLYPLTIAE